MAHSETVSLGHDKLVVGSTANKMAILGIFLAIVGGVAAYLSYGRLGGTPEAQMHFYHAYLFAYTIVLSITLGALFFVIVQHLARAGWSVAVRRLPESIANNMILMALLAVPLLFGMHDLFHWTHKEAVAADPILQGKEPYLNTTFFLVRQALYFTLWIGLAVYYRSTSIRQDHSGDARLSKQMEKVSAPAIILFGFSLTFWAFDWLMGLNSHWFSTIFGVYFFAGCVLAFLSFMLLLTFWLRNNGYGVETISHHHQHDLGKLLFAFTFFWGYIAFSQYMLIWYANIPEETQFYIPRQVGMWGTISLMLLIVHLVIPFPGLLSRHVKRRTAVLSFWAVWMMSAHIVDMFWLIMPNQWINKIPAEVGNAHMPLQAALPQLLVSNNNIYELKPEHADFAGKMMYPLTTGPLVLAISLLVGMLGLYLVSTALLIKKPSIVPTHDPRLAESLKFENA